MVNKFLILSLSFIILACGSKNTNPSLNTDSLNTDSLKNEVVSTGEIIVQVSDSITLDTIPLSGKLVRQWVFKELLSDDYHLKYFLEIDSIKSAGKYSDYIQSLDIGMTKDSRSWIYDTLSIQEGTAYVWGISYDSYEACPHFSGKTMYLTTVSKNGTPNATIKLTEISSGGDPPSFGADWGTCQIGTDFIVCTDTSMFGEYGDDGYDDVSMIPASRRYSLASGGSIKLLEDKKEAEIKMKRKQNN
jgi:hypothetical protein